MRCGVRAILFEAWSHVVYTGLELQCATHPASVLCDTVRAPGRQRHMSATSF